jgi:hypothetical protein
LKNRLSIFLPNFSMPLAGKPGLGTYLGTYNFSTSRWTSLNHRLQDASGRFELRMVEYLEVVGLTHNSTAWDGPYQRNAKGEILEAHIPKRLTNDEVLEALKPKPDQRGKNPASLSNLKPNLIHFVRHKRESQFDEDDFRIAQLMRDADQTWRQVGDRLRCAPNAIKTAMNRRAKQSEGVASPKSRLFSTEESGFF